MKRNHLPIEGNLVTASFKMAVISILSTIMKWTMLGIVIIILVYFVVDYSSTDAIDKYIKATTALNVNGTTFTKEKFKQTYLETTDKISETYFSTQTSESSGTLGDITSSLNISMSGNWYDYDLSGLSKGNAVSDEGDGVSLYNGLPWDIEEGCYFYNADVATTDFYNLMTATLEDRKTGMTASINTKYGLDYLLGKGAESREVYEYTYNYLKSYSHVDDNGTLVWDDPGSKVSANIKNGDGWKRGSFWFYKTLDGVNCAGVCILPAAQYPEFCSSWSKEGLWHSKNYVESYNYDNSRAAIVFQKLGTAADEYYYLPVTYGDMKAHTFPGGIAQTQVTVNVGKSSYNDLSVRVWNDGGEYTDNDWSIDNIGYKMYTTVSDGSILARYARSIVESIGWSSNFRAKIADKNTGYRVVGYVIWP